jgi:superfamily II DNA or RNA helicase
MRRGHLRSVSTREVRPRARRVWLLLKRLTSSDLPWFQDADTEHLSLDARRLPWLKIGMRERPVRVRWHEGQRIAEAVCSMARRGERIVIRGPAGGGARQATARASDVGAFAFQRVDDVVGGSMWLLTIDLVRAAEDDELSRIAERLLRRRAAVSIGGKRAESLLALLQRGTPAFGAGPALRDRSLTEAEWRAARDWLVRHLPVVRLQELLELGASRQADRVLASLGQRASHPVARELAEAVLKRYGNDLLSDAHRRALLGQARHGSVPALDQFGTWLRGSDAAKRFAVALGLPPVMAGNPVPPAADFEDVVALAPLGTLHDYQRQIADGLRETLHARSWWKRRAVVWLPTGTGKTRLCAETLVSELLLAPPQNCILWIADREELCEQAVETFRHVWLVLGHGTPSARNQYRPMLRIARFWGGRRAPELPQHPTLLVASIQTLARRLERASFERKLAELARRFAVVVFDEAHHVVAPTYRRVICALGLAQEPNLAGADRRHAPPLLGLTATPARSSLDETERLAKRFHGRLLEPEDPYRSMSGFIEAGYLARPRFEVRATGYVLERRRDEDAYYRKTGELPSSALRRTGRDAARTARIIADLEPTLERLKSVLIFACSVEHAETLAQVLSRRGHRAAAIHGGSPRSVRWSLISRFRQGLIKALVSCDLLTTGFDAPNVDAVVIARPVDSRVLFAQMIGRGLRGPRNGGTAECLLIDYEDNVSAYFSLDELRAEFRRGFLSMWDEVQQAAQ